MTWAYEVFPSCPYCASLVSFYVFTAITSRSDWLGLFIASLLAVGVDYGIRYLFSDFHQDQHALVSVFTAGAMAVVQWVWWAVGYLGGSGVGAEEAVSKATSAVTNLYNNRTPTQAAAGEKAGAALLATPKGAMPLLTRQHLLQVETAAPKGDRVLVSIPLPPLDSE